MEQESVTKKTTYWTFRDCGEIVGTFTAGAPMFVVALARNRRGDPQCRILKTAAEDGARLVVSSSFTSRQLAVLIRHLIAASAKMNALERRELQAASSTAPPKEAA